MLETLCRDEAQRLVFNPCLLQCVLTHLPALLALPLGEASAVTNLLIPLCSLSIAVYEPMLAAAKRNLLCNDRRWKVFGLRTMVRLLAVLGAEREMVQTEVLHCALHALLLPAVYRHVLYSELLQVSGVVETCLAP
jgi:hypothetical protein